MKRSHLVLLLVVTFSIGAAFVRATPGETLPVRGSESGARSTGGAPAGLLFDDSRLSVLGPTKIALCLAGATLVSEDLACISAGLLVARGELSVVAAILGCFFGIFSGDVLLYLLGRVFSRLLVLGGTRWKLVTPEAIERGRALLLRHGGKAILISRFMPGLRVPTYLASGAFAMPFCRFVTWFAVAGLLWTPCLVLLSGALGERSLTLFAGFREYGVAVFLACALAILVLYRIALSGVSAFEWRARRRWRGRLSRLRRWEFWPALAFYPPVVLEILKLTWKHRGFAVVTAVNPAIENGGFIGESKIRILDRLRGGGDLVAKSALVRARGSKSERIAIVQRFRAENGLRLPLVLKPDVGQRGSGIKIFRDEESLARFLEDEMTLDHVVQEYVPGVEYGIFYIRHPDDARGRIFSITEKKMPVVVGDGVRSIEDLILADERAVCAAGAYFDRNRDRLNCVPAAGESIQLVELGTHCRGAIFLDGAALLTPALEAAIERVSRSCEGFHFGRYDVRGPSAEHFRRGEGFKIIELNGVTSEATHVYDPKHGLVDAYRVLFEQWRIAFEIGAYNAARGAPTTSLVTLILRFFEYRREQRRHALN